ncbi:MAG: Abi family protein [Muribaculaceae bacterium]|nr:Abi family protein [Muribaculaceae bacterium]
MTKTATTIQQQLELLESRGLTINNRDKAKEILLDIGYYRLGFYLFPLEQTYPALENRNHQYIAGATFEDAVRLYYFDFDLRLILMRYLNRIEIAFRTAMIYHLSNKYQSNPIWFVSPAVVNRNYAQNFENVVYNSDFRRNPIIHRHHLKNPNDRFAPAWKSLEFMTFGSVIKLYDDLKVEDDKIFIAHEMGVRQVVTFNNYMHTIRQVRNACAHGLLLYDLRLPRAIRRGPAGVVPAERNNIIGSLRVINYVMRQISSSRANEMINQIKCIYTDLCMNAPILKSLIPDFSEI